MKKYILSAFVIASFIMYAVYYKMTGVVPASVPTTDNSNSSGTSGDVVIVPSGNPQTPAPTPTAMYKDGTYTGPVVDAYYGNIQVEAIIQGGKLADVKLLQYPNDRSTSIRINTDAMKIWKKQAIAIQAAKVDIVSGATDSSGAFNKSLGVALAEAKN